MKFLKPIFSDRNNLSVILVLLIFATVFSLISLVNHYQFRTSGYDLGLYNNALYDFAHFKGNTNPTLFENTGRGIKNILGDHFSLIIPLVSPLYWIFKSYTLLIVQILSVLFGGLGTFKLIKSYTKNHTYSLLSMIFFFSLWGIYSALSFDYHDNVNAAMFVPWFIYFIFLEKWKWSAVFFILILVCKENMALWMIFISIGLILLFLKKEDKKKRFYLSIYIFSSILYFILVINVLIPFFNQSEETYRHFHYNVLGDNFSDAIYKIFTKPKLIFTYLFENDSQRAALFGIKSELHFTILLSGGIALLYRPQFLIMLIPIYAQKLLNDSFDKWGLNQQYSIEFVPILTIAFFIWFWDLKNFRYKKLILYLAVILCAVVTYDSFDNRVSKWYGKSRKTRIKFYEKEHYNQSFNVKLVHDKIKQIPEDAVVSAQSLLVPHLALRDSIFMFPVINKAEYIALVPGVEHYPWNKEKYNKAKNKILNSKDWEMIYKDEDFILAKRKK